MLRSAARRVLLLCWGVVGGIAWADSASAAEIRPGTSAPPYTLVRVIPGQDEWVWILPLSSGSAVPKFDRIDGKGGEIGFTGEPGVYAVLWASPGGGPGQAMVTILPPGPVPPAPPVPPPGPPTPGPVVPEGFAGDVYRQAAAVGDKAYAAALAKAFADVHQEIGVSLTSLDQIYASIKSRTAALRAPQPWAGFNAWLSNQFRERAQTVAEAKEVIGQAAIGLGATSK